jgi:hypothetical protein
MLGGSRGSQGQSYSIFFVPPPPVKLTREELMSTKPLPTAGGPDVLPTPYLRQTPEPPKPDRRQSRHQFRPYRNPPQHFSGADNRGETSFVGRRANGPGRLPRTATPTRRSTAYCFCW